MPIEKGFVGNANHSNPNPSEQADTYPVLVIALCIDLAPDFVYKLLSMCQKVKKRASRVARCNTLLAYSDRANITQNLNENLIESLTNASKRRGVTGVLYKNQNMRGYVSIHGFLHANSICIFVRIPCEDGKHCTI